MLDAIESLREIDKYTVHPAFLSTDLFFSNSTQRETLIDCRVPSAIASLLFSKITLAFRPKYQSIV
jgi:hypothetical protein